MKSIFLMQKTEELLKDISKTYGQESYSSVPKNYKKGRHKYIIVTGSVMSGIGKGVVSSSLANLLKCHGLKISPVKFDGYINYDAGTLNPFRHGEVFVLEDGTETDLDLGSYERFLNQNLSKDNSLTTGKIFKTIIDKERNGAYLGRDVQFIPHVTGEIKLFLRNLAIKTNADITLVEVGGTVGDLENSYFLEAMRELAYEENKDNVCFVNVTYIIKPSSLNEHKSKAAQLGIKMLMSLGIQPNIIVCRSNKPISNSVKEKVSIFSNVPINKVVNVYNLSTIYDTPLFLKSINLDKEILNMLNLKPRKLVKQDLTFKSWENFVNKLKNAKKELTVGITGKYTEVHDSYLSILKALEHTAPYYNAKVNVKWIETTDEKNIDKKLNDVDGIIVPGGFGKRGTEGKIACVKYARENNIPYLGLCYGFQMAVIEFARNICNLKDANSTEIDANTKHPVIDILPEQKKLYGLGGNMRLGSHKVEVKRGTKAYSLYKSDYVNERFRHRFECNPEYIKLLEDHGMVFSGRAPKQEIMQILELPKHRYFIGTQFHGEMTSKPLHPSPLFKGFIEAMVNKL